MSNVCVPMEPVEPKREILRWQRKVEEECEKPEHGIVNACGEGKERAGTFLLSGDKARSTVCRRESAVLAGKEDAKSGNTES